MGIQLSSLLTIPRKKVRQGSAGLILIKLSYNGMVIPSFSIAIRDEELCPFLKERDCHKACKSTQNTKVTAVDTAATIQEHHMSKVSDPTYIGMRMFIMNWVIIGTQKKKAKTLTHNS